MSQHQFSPDDSTQHSPRSWYLAASQKQGFIHDSAQAAAIDRLQALYEQLLEFRRKRHRPFGKLLPTPDLPKGLYFWGGVGRGKSFLMDAFYSCVPYKRKKRIHFHHFMHDVHEELKRLKNEPDPLVTVAKKIARQVRLLCFDEFHVSDIADAMILGRLLTVLFDEGVVMVMTSNYEPSTLYPHGLQRENFLPTIALLKAQLEVLNVDGGNDYRLRNLESARTYISPLSDSARGELTAIFEHLATAADLPADMVVEGRKLRAVRHAPGVVWFDFATLCGGPRSQNDYLELAREYHSIILSDVPKLAASQASEARRFTWLVDVLYDNRVKLFISAAVPAEDIYTDGVQSSEFFRTASRLTEMQSREYLALAHMSN